MGLWNKILVPVVNSLANVTIADVIGNKDDRTYNGGDSIFAETHTLGDHAHKSQLCYPTLADGIMVTGGAGAWELGSFVEVMPADTASDYFDIHWVHIEALSAVDVGEVYLYYGASDTFYGRCRATRDAQQSGAKSEPMQGPPIAKGERIRAKFASAGGGSDTVTLSLYYHVY